MRLPAAIIAAAATAAASAASASSAVSTPSGQVTAGAPTDLIVTVYRAPGRDNGSIDLDELQGFALVTETRLVHLPAGTSRVRFEGVADGIEPASALITGLPGEVIEKNRDASLLSPSTLLAATVGKPMELLRTNRKTGKTERLAGTVLSDAGGGVVFKTDQGIEALRCSGLPETFSFAAVGGLAASPTLSVEVRTPAAVTQPVTLSYLARGFDWSADYTATLSSDGQRLDLGAWVTLANANGVGFPSAHTQVVAGKVNRENGEVEPIDVGGPIMAQCWPRGSTSDFPMLLAVDRFRSLKANMPAAAPMAAMRADVLNEIVVVTGSRLAQQEQLGDLKLYRIPDRTTFASRQSKQVRLMDQFSIPVTSVYQANLEDASDEPSPAHRVLRTRNTVADHLGLPLPSGRVAVFAMRDGEQLLQHESGIRDIAVDEELEIDMGESPDVRVSLEEEARDIDAAHAKQLPLVPGVILRSVKADAVLRAQVSNARAAAIQFELQIPLPDGARIVRADHPLGTKNGRPIFRFKVPANDTVTVRLQTQTVDEQILRTP